LLSTGEGDAEEAPMRTTRAIGSQERHVAEIRKVYERVLAGASARSRRIEVAGRSVHILEDGVGPPLVLLHGTTATAGMFVPLLNELHECRAVAPDRPGHGLSDPVNLPPGSFRSAAVAWVDSLLDTLELETTALLGHSGGAMWALWYALAHPSRVTKLVLLGPPALPKTRCPLPLRLVATPGLGELLSRVARPTRKSVLQFAGAMHEREALATHPDLVDLFVATGRDPIRDQSGRMEIRVFASPAALLSPSGFRRRSRVQPEELHRLATPTLIIWGAHEPLGNPSIARAATELMPQARLDVLPGGHAPWLAHASRTAASVENFVLDEPNRRHAAVT
jgi:pimeloyl-ACP methyl ester carboxylesterase